MTGTLKQCRKCNEWKPVVEGFHKNQHACKECRKRYAESINPRRKAYYRRYYSTQRNKKRLNPYNRASNLVANARSRSKTNGWEFSLTTEMVHSWFIAQNNCCAQTGIEFVFETIGKQRSLRAPSLDRKNVDEGYTVENTQLVCLFYNIAKNQSSDEEVWALIYQAVTHRRGL